ncbi:MAG: phosphoribosylglycinamide formyltransferase [Clostridiales bacterium]|uniref:phosphoribosylglycinamide formyltransferase n=1 Tax=Clostridium sp. N3C TaxID=1776758 RepID=UPI00092DF55C|nr:phosphoribosylglycinamide formyltransferase [Clostridium sp. N3C]NLZ47819.1 phosphoribosylglycinamide formyltransferase [Clostridiales bacterium]SCN22339.1 Phosphoribosylglycinamide formyltransferase [Clostridium sp. N3C]
MHKIAVLISGSGTNLQAIIDNVESGKLNCSIEYVISDKADVYGLKRAEEKGIKTYVLEKKVYKSKLSDAILEIVDNKVDFIVLAGFLSILQGEILEKFNNRIINVHPSLIPSFCGSGMYGIKVHESVIKSGVKVSGCTVHFVDKGTDTGPIILQKVVPVYFEDDAESLQKRVLEQEHIALPEALALIIQGKVSVVDKRVKIS